MLNGTARVNFDTYQQHTSSLWAFDISFTDAGGNYLSGARSKSYPTWHDMMAELADYIDSSVVRLDVSVRTQIIKLLSQVKAHEYLLCEAHASGNGDTVIGITSATVSTALPALTFHFVPASPALNVQVASAPSDEPATPDPEVQKKDVDLLSIIPF